MRGKMILAAGALACTLATNANAQGIAIIPFGGYALGGTLAEDDATGDVMKVKSSVMLGLQIELGLSKNLAIDIGVNQTMGGTIELSGPTISGDEDLTMRQFTGSLVIRPAGRRPNGGVTPLMIEVGGGVTMYSFGSASQAQNFDDFDATSPMFFAGAGYNMPIGPRATIQIFGRAQMITAYESDGLDAFNAIPPATNIEGKSMFNIQVGVGLRFGR